jgi:hypothetical protein
MTEHLANTTLAIQIKDVDGKLHADGMHGLAGKNPEAFTGLERAVIQQALAPESTGVGPQYLIRDDFIPRHIQNGQQFNSGMLLHAPNMLAKPIIKPAQEPHAKTPRDVFVRKNKRAERLVSPQDVLRAASLTVLRAT